MPGISLEDWGPSGWDVLHVFAHTAPRELTAEQVSEYRTFFEHFARLLPCSRCRTHFQRFLASRMTDEALATRHGMVTLMNDAHNEINASHGKKTYSLPEHYRVYLTKPPVRITAPVVVAVVACLLLLVASCYRRPAR